MNFEENSLKQAGISGNVRKMTPLGRLVWEKWMTVVEVFYLDFCYIYLIVTES